MFSYSLTTSVQLTARWHYKRGLGISASIRVLFVCFGHFTYVRFGALREYLSTLLWVLHTHYYSTVLYIRSTNSDKSHKCITLSYLLSLRSERILSDHSPFFVSQEIGPLRLPCGAWYLLGTSVLCYVMSFMWFWKMGVRMPSSGRDGKETTALQRFYWTSVHDYFTGSSLLLTPGGTYITPPEQNTHKPYLETLKKAAWHWKSNWFLVKISQGHVWQQMTCLSLARRK